MSNKIEPIGRIDRFDLVVCLIKNNTPLDGADLLSCVRFCFVILKFKTKRNPKVHK